MTEFLRVMEVGPRDGLQNLKKTLAVSVRREFIRRLLEAGVKTYEAGAFVRPDKVPQMADSEELWTEIKDWKGEAYFLVPNEKGLEKALSVKIKNLAFFMAATETFNQKNVGMGMKESLGEFKRMIPRCKQLGLGVRGYVSVVWGCPFEKKTPLANVLSAVESLLEMECDEISLGDTIGVARPNEIKNILNEISKRFDLKHFAVHLHDTYGMAVANIAVALQEGIRIVDAAAGGLGGCPFAPGASGNVGTEDVLYLAEGLGFQTGLDLRGIVAATRYLQNELGDAGQTACTSRVFQALRS